MENPTQMVPYVNGDGDYFSENFLVRASDEEVLTRVFCRWKMTESPADDALHRFHSLDLRLSIIPISPYANGTEGHPRNATGTALEILVRRIGQNLARSTEVAALVILAPSDGYLCKSDILEARMGHSEFIDTVVSFGAWDRRLLAFSRHDKSTLLPLLLSSPGAIIVKQSPLFDHTEWMKLMRRDLEMRLSFDWIVPNKPDAYRVALVAGRHLYDAERVTDRAQGFLEAAKALGMAVTVLGEPGHWLEGGKYAHLRDDFIAMDISTPGGLSGRIVESVRGRDIDGIVTFTDELLIDVAEAAEMLGMPTEPAEAVWQAHHKQEMRKAVENTNVQALSLNEMTQLDDPAMAKKLGALRYPLIVKPAYGRASAGVRKVADAIEMREAVRLLHEEGLAEYGIVLETFVDGPELDCNFVLRDGKILFFEATDDLPSAGDASNATLADTFFETAMISNSGLPPEEIEILRSSLHRSLLPLGLGWGVFHVEARIRGSSMRYEDSQGDGILDLVVNSTIGNATTGLSLESSAFMVEANVHPPGIAGSWATLYTYGVDFHALHLLRAVGDRERFDSLSKPFLFPAGAGGGGGAQHWTAQCVIPVHREDIRVPDAFFEKLHRIVPDMAAHTAIAEVHAKCGTVVSPSGGVGLFAWCVLYSRMSRRYMLEMCHRVAEAARKVLDGQSDKGEP